MQNTDHLLMIRPVRFSFNAETAVNNSFQVNAADENVAVKAMLEFDNFVEKLRTKGIDVTVVEDSPIPHTPDSVFPNNWVSFHEDGTLCLYPMFAVNRRAERKQQVLDAIASKFMITKTIDFTKNEHENRFLEGTGSMILDRDLKLVYACLSPRTDATVLDEYCAAMQYSPITFSSLDATGQPIYHTNVMMCVADAYVVICLDSITNVTEKEHVIATILGSGKQLIPISIEQVNRFAGNMLQVKNTSGQKFLVMSLQAYESLTAEQVATLTAYNEIICPDISVIETNGGGSARCMMAEVFLPLK